MGREDLWDITKREHTQLKLDILDKYLRAWARIIGENFPDSYYIDCFAGRGKYHKNGIKDCVLGSPLIAQKIGLEIQAQKQKKEKIYNFKIIAIEANKNNFEDLNKFLKENDPKEEVYIEPKFGEFQKIIPGIIKNIGSSPAFFFVDPYGIKIPKEALDALVDRAVSLEKTELFFNYIAMGVERVAGLIKTTEHHKKRIRLTAINGKNNNRSIKRKSLLYRTGVEYGDFCINHVEGCSHGCRYPCYAMMMKRRAGAISSYEDWCQPKLVSNALELLEKEIPRYKDKIKSVHLCFATDPFMYGQEEVSALSLEIIRRLNANSIPCTVLTKGVYPINAATALNVKNQYGITLVSLDEDFRKNYEPYTAGFEERIESLRNLHQRGLKTWVSIEPYPTPNIKKQDLREILESITFVNKIVFGKLNYNSDTKNFINSRIFYNSQAKTVMDFCRKNKIECYIKEGTLTA